MLNIGVRVVQVLNILDVGVELVQVLNIFQISFVFFCSSLLNLSAKVSDSRKYAMNLK